MNKQRKVLITITYNEMGIIIDTKAEEVAQPEIIRCKDCNHFAGGGMYCDCDIMVHYDHFYCYYGEREDGEADD